MSPNLPPVRLIMLDMKSDKHDGRTYKQTGNGAGAAGYANRVELLTG